MSPASGAHAPEVTMCQHVVAANLQRPFALYATKRTAQYACPTCLVAAIERRLTQPGAEPATIAESCHFTRCGHERGGSQRACWVCLEAACSALTSRWAELHFTNRSAANKLLRVRQAWNKHYNPGRNLPRPAASPRYGPQAVLTAEQRQEQRSAKALLTMRQNKYDNIRRNRGLPEKGAIHWQQTEQVIVVPSMQ